MRGLAAILALAFAGCLHQGATTCADGTTCPTGTKCVAVGDAAQCALATCGNGVIDQGETCDDGNNFSGDGCPAACGAACGDGIVDPGEACDDGNTTDGDGCAATCKVLERCGNGVLDPQESCDDGNLRSHDGCSSLCTTETSAWTALADAPATVSALTYEAKRQVIDLVDSSSTVWQWDGVIWRKRAAIGDSPPPRTGAALTFDPVRDRLVLYGGADPNGGRYSDTWEFDGRRWTTASNTITAPNEWGPQLAYDAHRERSILFGATQQTWEWDGTTWSLIPTAHHAPADGALLYDGDHATIVLVTTTADHRIARWTFDGVDWTEHVDDAPAPSRFFSAAYDHTRHAIVAHGGAPMFETTETDTWDGQTWQRSADPSPVVVTAVVDYVPQSELVAFGLDWVGVQSSFAVWRWTGMRWEQRRDRARTLPPHEAGEQTATDGRLVYRVGTSTSDVWTWDGVNWRAISSQLPPRSHTRLVFEDPYEVLEFGGLDPDGAVLGDFERFSGGWSAIPSTPTPSPRFDQAMVSLGNTLLLFGGRDVDHAVLGDLWLWRSSTGFVEITPPSGNPPARAEAVLAFDPERARAMMFGGVGSDGSALLDAWEWDGSAWHAIAVPAIDPAHRRGLAYDSGRHRTVLADAELWEWDGNTWSALGDASALPSDADPTTLQYVAARDRLVVLGGDGDASVAMEWDGTRWISDPAASGIPGARHGAGFATDDPLGVAVLVGGAQRPMVGDVTSGLAPRADAWTWSAGWTATTSLPTPIAFPIEVADRASSTVAVSFGVVSDAPPPSNPRTFTWRGTDAWVSVPNVVQVNAGAAATFDPVRHTAVAFGGLGPSGPVGETWTWSADWMAMPVGAATGGPTPRAFAAMAFDEDRGVAVMFGGRTADATDSAELWEWNGTSWTLRTPLGTLGPTARSHHAMVWDDRRHRVVLFGGAANGQLLDDTWEWNGEAWSLVPLSRTPGRRRDTAVARDPRRGGLVLIGGGDRETWFLRFDDPTVPDEGCIAGVDGDGDGLTGCDDPDCFCSP